MNGAMVDFEKRNGNLVITLTPQGRESLAETEDEKNINSDDFMLDFFEHQLCNGWTSIPPESIAALTSAPILSDEAERDDDGVLVKIGRVYWFPNYQVESPIETLRDTGTVIFTGVD